MTTIPVFLWSGHLFS